MIVLSLHVCDSQAVCFRTFALLTGVSSLDNNFINTIMQHEISPDRKLDRGGKKSDMADSKLATFNGYDGLVFIINNFKRQLVNKKCLVKS